MSTARGWVTTHYFNAAHHKRLLAVHGAPRNDDRARASFLEGRTQTRDNCGAWWSGHIVL